VGTVSDRKDMQQDLKNFEGKLLSSIFGFSSSPMQPTEDEKRRDNAP
jgi:hypothetical protein